MFQGWWIVATHFMVMFFATGFYTYALPLIVPPVIEELGSDASTINSLFSIVMILGAVVSPLAGPLVDKWSARGLLLIGVGALIAALVGLSYAQSDSTFVLMGILLGISGPLCGPMAGSAVISRWFTATRGRALGIAAIGTSIGGFVVPRSLGYAIEAGAWRDGLRGLAVVVAVVTIPLLLLRFWDRPEHRGVIAEPAPAGAAGQAIGDEPALTSGEILKRLDFWLFTIGLSLFLACYMGTVANLGKYFSDAGFNAGDAGSLMSYVALGGVLGKLGFGYLADRLPLKVAFSAAIVSTAFAIFLLTLMPGYGILALATFFLGVATGGILPVWNAIVPVLFGLKNFGRAMGLMAPATSLVSAPTFLVIGIVRDSAGSYVPVFQGFLGVLAASLLVILPLKVVRGGAAKAA